MSQKSEEEVRSTVREFYGRVADVGAGARCAPGCCGAPAAGASLQLGYSAEELASMPEGADMGLGCGNPQAIAALRPGRDRLRELLDQCCEIAPDARGRVIACEPRAAAPRRSCVPTKAEST